MPQYGQMGAYGAYNPAGAAQARPAVVAPGAAQWSEHKTDEGVPYWHNPVTGVSQVSENLVYDMLLL